jgi:hypothetical protein
MSDAEIIPFPLCHLLSVIAASAPYPPEIVELGATFGPVLVHFRVGLRIPTKTGPELAQWFNEDPETVGQVAKGIADAMEDLLRAAKLLGEAVRTLLLGAAFSLYAERRLSERIN